MPHATSRTAGAARTILGVLLGVGFLVASAAPAAAHTSLAASSPRDGAKLDAAPNAIVLEFSSPILTTADHVVVQDPGGRPYQQGVARVTQNKLTQPLKPLGPPGRYHIEFRIVAADGHPQGGELAFTLTKPGPAQAGSGAAVARPAPTAAVQTSTTANNAPGWAPWITIAALVILGSSAIWFGRRVTRGLD